MITRRVLIGSLAMTLAEVATAGSSSGTSKVVYKHPLPDVSLKDWSITAVEVSYGPGESSAPHRHPGITIAYVLEGEIRSKVADEREETYAAGQMFIEMPNQVHAVSRNANANKPARLLALLLTENGKPLTTPVND